MLSKSTGIVKLSLGCFTLLSFTVTGCGKSNGTSNSNQSGQSKMASSVTLNETGSSLLYPLFESEWIPAYQKVASRVRLNAAATGSGTGISEALAGTVEIGASDAYLSNSQMMQSPHILNIPLAVSAQQVMYHVPEVPVDKHLRLTGNVLAKMYLGQIRYWDDTRLTSLNPGIKLPHHRIVLVNRSDSSGDTFLFTQFLMSTNVQWASAGLTGTSVSWPSVQGEVGGKGNSGVVDAMAATPYSIGYVGISWLDSGVSKGLGYAALMNRSGSFVLPTAQSIQAAAHAGSKNIKTDARQSLIYEPGAAAYPIANFEYAIVNQTQQTTVVGPLKSFLTWAISPSGGNQPKFLKPVHFLPLPSNVSALSKKRIALIGQS